MVAARRMHSFCSLFDPRFRLASSRTAGARLRAPLHRGAMKCVQIKPSLCKGGWILRSKRRKGCRASYRGAEVFPLRFAAVTEVDRALPARTIAPYSSRATQEPSPSRRRCHRQVTDEVSSQCKRRCHSEPKAKNLRVIKACPFRDPSSRSTSLRCRYIGRSRASRAYDHFASLPLHR